MIREQTLVDTTARKSAQLASAGGSANEIHLAALDASAPVCGLSWADVGCGTGELLGLIRDQYAPDQLIGTDLLAWLPEEWADVEFIEADALDAVEQMDPVDRLLLIEVLEHLESPWLTLRAAAQKVRPGGRLVATTPNVKTIRNRLHLGLRGQLTSFEPDNHPHLGPILPHVTCRILREEGLEPKVFYCLRDVIPWTRGRRWGHRAVGRYPTLTCSSVGVVAVRSA